jgi:hypothetical protein
LHTALLPNEALCPIPGLPNDIKPYRRELFAFDDVHHAAPTIYTPASTEQLSTLLAHVPSDRRVTIRAGGQSIDDQSLNSDLVFHLHRPFDWIGCPTHDENGYAIEVGAAARWEGVLNKIAPLGLMPPSVATAQYATVGGTMSADCLSRMSCVAGKEGQQIREFTLVLPCGTELDCKKTDSGLRGELFKSVIGGFGYLGVVTKVTFDLVASRADPMRPGPTPCVFTRSTRSRPSTDWDTVLRELQSKSVSASRRYAARAPFHRGVGKTAEAALASAPEWSALSMASFLTGSGLNANVLEQRYVAAQPLRPFPGGIYQRTNGFPAVVETTDASWPTLVDVGLDFCPEGEFVDELFGWTFFLGYSATMAKEEAYKCGHRVNFTQQSFALPAGPDANRVDTRETRRFLELLIARLHAADLQPATIDFLYVPADDFVMSASRGLFGFIVTVSFVETNRTGSFSPELVDTLHSLSSDCRSLGGRVHLVKGVNADPGDLRAMYGDAAKEFLSLKQRVDPKRILRNEFFERVFLA